MALFRYTTILLCFLSGVASAQTIKVQPYLQDAEPHSIYVLWETSSEASSSVQWGLTESLGNTATGTSYVSQGNERIQEVQLAGLERFTKYYYRAISGTDTTEIFHFKTPPFSSDNESFRLIAMSDMQRDGSVPDKFEEVVNDGVIDYLESEFGGDLVDNLALVMIPGDLVVNGNTYSQWENTFFEPAQNLISQVPVYPVPGNHENNAVYYFRYFRLPDNGTEGFEEHWWYKDYGNVRMIGLDSNAPFRNAEQLEWLDDILAETCQADSIDFVFAQLHHPFKSELWTPGEVDYTGDVISRMEAFSSECGKPSIHFFGHTHGYSRGQSRDHKHLWINAATAGGAIDLWGEWPQFDYDEFSVSQDEYGFVSVEITGGDDAKFVVKRITRGDKFNVIDNELSDQVSIDKEAQAVNTPIPVQPIDNELALECVVLVASQFAGQEPSSEHGQSHWQVSTSPDDFSNPVVESWKNFENWYFEQDTQAEDDLTDEKIEGLQENTDYWWRVRYRDKRMNWSSWSAVSAFSTGTSNLPPNLVLNPGAEDDLNHWTIISGVVESVTDGECNGISPYEGARYFAVGGLCEHSDEAICAQDISVESYHALVDAGDYPVHFGGALADYSGSDVPEMRLIFLDELDGEIATSATLENANPDWLLMSESMNVPAQTRTIRIELKGTRNAGTDNDSYFDAVFVRLGAIEGNDCDEVGNTTSLFVELDWDESCGAREMHTRLYIPGTNTLVAEFDHVVQQDGPHEILNVPVGTFDVYIQVEGNLQQGYFNQDITEGSNTIDLNPLVVGDVNSDNGVNVIDFSLFNTAFGSSAQDPNYHSLTDLNCDDGVNIIDFSLLNISFGLVGDSPAE